MEKVKGDYITSAPPNPSTIFLLPSAVKNRISLSQQGTLLKLKLLEKGARLGLLEDIVRGLR